MKSLLAALALTTALSTVLVLPGAAQARPVTLTTTLNAYGGDGAYLALYVTDASGAYKGMGDGPGRWARRKVPYFLCEPASASKAQLGRLQASSLPSNAMNQSKRSLRHTFDA